MIAVMTDMRTKATQSVAEILDGLKRDAVQAVKHLLEDRRLEAMPVDAAIRLGWMDEDGQAYGGNITKVSLDGERLCVQVQGKSLSCLFDERQFMPGCHIWLAQLKEAILHAPVTGRQTA